MKLRSIIAGALALVMSVSFAVAQTNQGTSPLTVLKGGTNCSAASVTCLENIISAAVSAGIDKNTLNARTANYTLATTDCGKTITLGGSAFFTLTVSAASGYAATCSVVVANIDTGRGKKMTINGVTFPNNNILWPGQSFILKNESNVWTLIAAPGPWLLPSDITWYVDPVTAGASNSNDCLASGASACLSIAGALAQICGPIDANNHRPIIQLADNTTLYTTQVNGCEVKGSLNGSGGFAGTPVLRGNTTTLGNVVINTTSSSGFSAVGINTIWRLEGIEFKITTGGTAVVADVQSKIYTGKNKYTVTSAGNVFQALNGGFIEWVDDFTISGAANVVMYANNGGRFVSQPVTVTISGTPAWAFAFAYFFSNATAYMPGITFSGSATGNRCNLASAGGVDTNGAGATYLPGNVSCTGTAIANPGWYN